MILFVVVMVFAGFGDGHVPVEFVSSADKISVEERVKALDSDDLDTGLRAAKGLLTLRDSGPYNWSSSTVHSFDPAENERIYLRTRAAYALYGCDNIPLRIKLMQSQDVKLRLSGIHGCFNLLGAKPNFELVQSLLSLIADPSPECRGAVAHTFYPFRRFSEDLVETMYKALENEREPKVVAAFVRGFHGIFDDRGIRTLLPYLRAQDEEVLQAAMSTFYFNVRVKGIGDPLMKKAVDEMSRLLRQKSGETLRSSTRLCVRLWFGQTATSPDSFAASGKSG